MVCFVLVRLGLGLGLGLRGDGGLFGVVLGYLGLVVLCWLWVIVLGWVMAIILSILIIGMVDIVLWFRCFFRVTLSTAIILIHILRYRFSFFLIIAHRQRPSIKNINILLHFLNQKLGILEIKLSHIYTHISKCILSFFHKLIKLFFSFITSHWFY